LHGKVPDVNVTRALSGDTSVDHIDGLLVVAMHDGGAFWWKAKIGHDCAHMSSMLCGGNSGEKFRFGGARSGDRLRLASVGNGAATQEEGIAGSGSTIAQIVCMRSIQKCNGFLGVHSRKVRQLGIHRRPDEVGRGKRGIWLGPTVDNAPVFGSSEAFSDLFEHSEVMVMRASGELR